VDFSGYNANSVGTVNADDVQLNTGTTVNEFSTDESLSDNSDDATPTEQAVKQYVDGQVSTTDDYLPDDPATSSVNMQGNPVQNLPSPSDNQDAVRKEYVDKQEISTTGCSWTTWSAGEVDSNPAYCGSDQVMRGVETAGENDAGENDCDDHEPNDANAWCVRAYCCDLQVNYVPDVVASIDYSDEATSSAIPSSFDVGADVSNTGTDSDTFDVTISGTFTNASDPLGCAGVSDSYTDSVTLNGGDSTSVSGTITGNTDCQELNQIDVSNRRR
jgi:hypothetical protein